MHLMEQIANLYKSYIKKKYKDKLFFRCFQEKKNLLTPTNTHNVPPNHQKEIYDILSTGMNLLDFEEQVYASGKFNGKMTKLIKQVCTKYTQGQSILKIAEDLMENEALINDICRAASYFAPDYDAESILAYLIVHKKLPSSI